MLASRPLTTTPRLGGPHLPRRPAFLARPAHLPLLRLPLRLAAKRGGDATAAEMDAKAALKAAKAAVKEAKKREKAAAAAAAAMEDDGDDDGDDDDDEDPHPSPPRYESVTATARGTGAPQHPQTILLTRDGEPDDDGGGALRSSPGASRGDALAARESALWDRQDALWAREMGRWEAERAGWAAREAALLGALAGMQAEVGRLAGQLAAGATPAGTLPPAAAAAAAPAVAPAAAVVPPFQAAPPRPPQAQVQAPHAVSFADHLAAAVAVAQGAGDVLADKFGGHGGLLAGGSAPATPSASRELTPVPAPPPPSPPAPAPHAATLAPVAPPPTLIEGSDDLFWVNALQAGLAVQAYHCGDEEAEDFYFGSGTRSALLTFQACAGLPETGVCDGATWTALLGAEGLADLRPPTPEEEEAADDALSAAVGVGRAGLTTAPAPPPAPAALPTKDSPVVETWSSSTTTTTVTDVEDAAHHHHTRVTVEEELASGSAVVVPPLSSPSPPRTAWPIVREGDGGRPVHELQVALNKHGFHCGDDDEQWWQFGDPTHAALATFQACSGLPESGVADEKTWLALLGPDATPEDGAALSAGNNTDDDMLGGHHEGMIYLVGEQRWARRETTAEN